MAPRIRAHQEADHPRLSLVDRDGDPAAAVGLAVAHDAGSIASVALGTLLEVRLTQEGWSVQSHPHELGFALGVRVSTPERAADFVQAAHAALSTPCAPTDWPYSEIKERLRALRLRTWAGPAELAQGMCSGELGILAGTSLPLDEGKLLDKLEAWRIAGYSARAVAFAALGVPEVLEAVSDAVAATPSWPEGSEPIDAWPPRNKTQVDRRRGSPRLSVAIRWGDGGAALQAARSLGERDSALAVRLAALDGGWRLFRTVGSLRRRGACLRLDLESEKSVAPTSAAVAQAAHVALDEAREALGVRVKPQWPQEQAVLGETDPREATMVAAWQSLSGQLAPGPPREFVSYRSGAPSRQTAREIARWLDTLATLRKRGAVESVWQLESGQGEIWMLLASPCGTAAEGQANAGATALLVEALAEKASDSNHVTIEPWITPDGVGLLAHGPRLGPNETAEAQANRIADGVGRTLVASRLSSSDIVRARNRLLSSIGGQPRPGFWLALDTVCPGHPSWLEPRGSSRSLFEVTAEAVEVRRLAWMRGPLRLAMLANWSQRQAAAGRKGLERWLRGLRTGRERCASSITPKGKQNLALEVQAGGESVTAYLVVPLPNGFEAMRQEAEWTTYLLNRPGGWLERALGAGAGAHARLLGGQRSAAVLVELHGSSAETKERVAVLRRLFRRLGQGQVDREDLAAARETSREWQEARRVNPRHRLIALWHGKPSPATDLGSMGRFLRHAFGRSTESVVWVSQRRGTKNSAP
ncbi:hypothetical protein ACFL5O_04440 [Myxococcota bacterium]